MAEPKRPESLAVDPLVPLFGLSDGNCALPEPDIAPGGDR